MIFPLFSLDCELSTVRNIPQYICVKMSQIVLYIDFNLR